MARFEQTNEMIRLRKANRKLRKTLRETKAGNVLHIPRNNDRPRTFELKDEISRGKKKPVQTAFPFDVAQVVAITLAVRDAIDKAA